MAGKASRPEKWAKIPESLIVGELLPGISAQSQASAFRLYCYLDLRQGATGWPARGFRTVAKAMGLQPRTVATAAKVLAEAGLVDLTVTTPAATKAVMRIIHNPARNNVNPKVLLGPPPTKDRHESLTYDGGQPARPAHTPARPAHNDRSTPDAQDAPGSRSMRSEWCEPENEDLMAPGLIDDLRCSRCFRLAHPAGGSDAVFEDFCSCPFLSGVGSR